MTAGGLHVQDLTVRYGETVAVHGVSIDVPQGQAVGLVGANGAGKSSLMQAIAGVVSKSGRVEVDGRPLASSGWRVARSGVRLVSEQRNLFDDLSVAQHLQVGARGLPGRDRAAAIEQTMSIFPALEQLTDRKAGFLSGGEKSMLAVARAIVAGPRVLLLDEPTLGLSPIATGQLIESLKRIRGTGMTILVSEQAVRVPRAVCDSLVVMKLGKVVDRGDTESVLASDWLRDALI